MKTYITFTMLALSLTTFASAKTQIIECQNEAGYSAKVELDASKALSDISEENPALGKITVKNKDVVVTDGKAIASFYLEHELYITSENSADLIIPQHKYAEEGSFTGDITSLYEYDDERIEVNCNSKIE